KATFSPVVVGLIGAAGLLTALVPGSMLLVSASTIVVQNVLRPVFRRLPERAAGNVAKGLVPVVALIAVFLTLRAGNTVVQLLLMGYNLVTQLFPPLLFALPRGSAGESERRASGHHRRRGNRRLSESQRRHASNLVPTVAERDY